MLLAGGIGGTVSSLGLVASIIGPLVAAIALAWALSRTQALAAWRAAAEGYKEQVTEMTARLTNAETATRELHTEVTRLSALPNYTEVVGSLEEIKGACGRIEGAVTDLGSRWG